MADIQNHLVHPNVILNTFQCSRCNCLFISNNLLSPVESGFLGKSYTAFALLLSVFILKERFTKREGF